MKSNPPPSTPIEFDNDTCRFFTTCKDSDESLTELVKTIDAPLSVILQITRECHFNCIFCSESEHMLDPTLEELGQMKTNLEGTKRVFLSGGEPLIRKDFPKVVDLFSDDFILGVPTNAVASSEVLASIRKHVNFVNIGLDGPRVITSRIRGDYDAVMNGIWQFKFIGVPISLTSVVLRSTADSIPYTCQIADVLGAKKLKLVLPIPKGNALELPEEEYMTHEECIPIFENLAREKERYGWKPKVMFTTWRKETEGYSILVYPNGKAYAWPVYDETDKVLYLGNLFLESIREIWRKYPYKENHLRKYVGNGVLAC